MSHSLPSNTFFFKFIYLFLFMAVLGLRFCSGAFSSCGKRGPLLIAVRGPLTIAASLVSEHRLQMRRLSNCGPRAQLLRGMWDLPRPELEPVSPALAGRLSTTTPPGKPPQTLFSNSDSHWVQKDNMAWRRTGTWAQTGLDWNLGSTMSLLHDPGQVNSLAKPQLLLRKWG